MKRLTAIWTPTSRTTRATRAFRTAGIWTLGATLLLGCPQNGDDGSKKIINQAPRNADGTIIDDRSMCKHKGRTDIEVAETAGPGAIQPNVRRVWKVFGEGADRRRVLECREMDTNLDGYKDVVRHYNDEGQAKKELADTNYDGKVDTWLLFAQGRVAEVHIDKNHDGNPDEWKIYNEGKLSRARRDTNFDKKPDVWEMYRKGRLERMGVDLDGDERVDRWDHDKEWRKQLDEDRKKKGSGRRKAPSRGIGEAAQRGRRGGRQGRPRRVMIGPWTACKRSSPGLGSVRGARRRR